MASKRRRNQPPWLQGVTVKKERTLKIDTPDSRILTVSTGNTTRQNDGDGDKLASSSNISTKKEEFKESALAVSHVPRSESLKATLAIKEEKLTIENVVALSFKEFLFSGSIIYSHNMDDCNLLCDDIIENLMVSDDVIMGLDTEWPVTYERGSQAKTALIQICFDTEKCYLFHVSCMPKFPVMLKKLLEMENVKKVGLNIENDLWKLDMDYDVKAKDIIQKSMIELRNVANKKLRSAENWSLEGLTRNVLQLRISKDPVIRKCDWRQFPLTDKQQQYAATDAVISLMLYEALVKK